jgi:hypothetical protein
MLEGEIATIAGFANSTSPLRQFDRARLLIYAAISAASVRVSDMLGIFGWGSSKNNASRPESKSGSRPILENAGASTLA